MQIWLDNGYSEEHFTLGVEAENETWRANSRFQIQRVRYIQDPPNPGFYFKLDWDGINWFHRYDINFDYYTARTGHSSYLVENMRVDMDADAIKAKLSDYIAKQFGASTQFNVERNKIENKFEKYFEIIVTFGSSVIGPNINQPVLTRKDGADKMRS